MSSARKVESFFSIKLCIQKMSSSVDRTWTNFLKIKLYFDSLLRSRWRRLNSYERSIRIVCNRLDRVDDTRIETDRSENRRRNSESECFVETCWWKSHEVVARNSRVVSSSASSSRASKICKFDLRWRDDVHSIVVQSSSSWLRDERWESQCLRFSLSSRCYSFDSMSRERHCMKTDFDESRETN